jgi:peptide deformylase
MVEIITDCEQLAKPASPLEFLTEAGPITEEGNDIIAKLLEAMENDEKLIALSAPQIGIDKRIFCIRFSDTVKVFIDPIITKKSKFNIAPETCASMPGKEILISRPEELTVVYYTSEYKYEENKLLGPAARLFDQQCQLLDGILPSELGLVSDVVEDGSLADLTEDEIAELIEVYKKYVKVKLEAIRSQIEADSELATKYKNLSFAERVVTGQAAVVVNDGKDRKAAVNKTVALSMKDLATNEKTKNTANLKQFLHRKGK